MNKILQHIILTAFSAMFLMAAGLTFSGSTASADEVPVIMDMDETALFELINAARRDPLGVAELLGMDRDEILNDLPELSEILINGLPELVYDSRLYKTANEHTLDMLRNNYYAYESTDGKSPEQRMQDAGYVPTHAGEALGLIYFNNFINSDQAIFQIFDNMYKDELSPEWVGARNILNPDFIDLGVGIGGGLYQLNGISGNVYLATCDFGASIELYELQLLQLINQLRAEPVEVAQFFGIEVLEILELFPEYADLFTNGLPPLAFNSQLYATAEVHAADMLENEYWGSVSSEGFGLVKRIRDQGYIPVWAAESKFRLSTCSNAISPTKMLPSIFKNMLFSAFRSQGSRDASMLAEKAVESGFRVIATQSRTLSGICGDNVHIIIGDFAAPRITAGTSSSPVLTGVIYEDTDENGLYDIGEGLPNVRVIVREPGLEGISRMIQTNDAGGYMINLQPGLYRIVVGSGDARQIQWITVETANIWQSFQVRNVQPIL